MVVVQTIGSVDMPGRGVRKMPAPRQYLAIFVTWLVLMFAASINSAAERAAAALGWLLVVVGMVVGPFGNQAVDFLRTIATNFPVGPVTPSSPFATGAASSASGAVGGVTSAGSGAAQGAIQAAGGM
jgi:hypothetical protein